VRSSSHRRRCAHRARLPVFFAAAFPKPFFSRGVFFSLFVSPRMQVRELSCPLSEMEVARGEGATNDKGGVLKSTQGNAYRAPVPPAGAKGGEAAALFQKPALRADGAGPTGISRDKENPGSDTAVRGEAAAASTSGESDSAGEKRWQVSDAKPQASHLHTRSPSARAQTPAASHASSSTCVPPQRTGRIFWCCGGRCPHRPPPRHFACVESRGGQCCWSVAHCPLLTSFPAPPTPTPVSRDHTRSLT